MIKSKRWKRGLLSIMTQGKQHRMSIYKMLPWNAR